MGQMTAQSDKKLKSYLIDCSLIYAHWNEWGEEHNEKKKRLVQLK